MNINNKHRWSDEEKRLISRHYINEYVLKPVGCNKELFLTRIYCLFPEIKESSIKMFVQNTKQLTKEFGVADSSTFSPLKNYSVAHKRIMIDLLKEYKLI